MRAEGRRRYVQAPGIHALADDTRRGGTLALASLPVLGSPLVVRGRAADVALYIKLVIREELLGSLSLSLPERFLIFRTGSYPYVVM